MFIFMRLRNRDVIPISVIILYETENVKPFTFFPEKIYMLFMSLCKRHNGTGLNVAFGS